MLRRLFVLSSVVLLAACGTPRQELNSVIEGQNFIPFNLPMPSVRVGTILRGNNNELYLVATPEQCLPDLPVPQALRWDQDTDIPNQSKTIEFAFNANLTPLMTGGNQILSFKASAGYVKTVSLQLNGVAVEFLNETAFNSFYAQSMTSECKSMIGQYGFIGQALKVTSMSFIFKDAAGAAINLTANMDSIVNINAGVEFKVTEDYTLTISTPKYIGYRMAKIDTSKGTPKISYASKVDFDGNWLFRDVDQARPDPAVAGYARKPIHVSPPLSQIL